MKLNIAELDCIFISYDEPNAEYNWADLSEKCIWAKRVHGVKGSDQCHKAAANLSETNWFVTVDGDNIVDSKFFDQSINLTEGTQALNWPGLNSINGLRYGNGSLKLWNKDFVLKMKTHESSIDDKGKVDFCWETGYRQMVTSFSTTVINSSPLQAWRAGFREGVKMSLVDGIKIQNTTTEKILWHNLHRLKIWMSVGMHIDNGVWAILGARQGFYMANCTDWNYVDVRNFDELEKIWRTVNHLDVLESIEDYGNKLKNEFTLNVPLLDQHTSKFVYDMLDDQYRQIVEHTDWIGKRNNV